MGELSLTLCGANGGDLDLTCDGSLRRKLGDDLHRFSFKWRNYICNGSLIRLGVLHIIQLSILVGW